MVRNALIQFIFFAFTALAGWTWVEGDIGAGIAGRATPGELMGLAIIAFALVKVFAMQARPVVPMPRHYQAALLLYFVYLISAAQGYNFAVSIFEVIIHLFIFTVSIALLVISGPITDDVLKRCLVGTLYGSGLIAAVGIAHFLFFPNWFAGAQGGLSGTFRNTGQAGAYFGMFLAVFIPAFMSGYLRLTPVRAVLVALLLIALVLTVKRSFMIGTVAGFGFALIGRLYMGRVSMFKQLGKTIFLSLIGATILFVVFNFSLENVHGFEQRFQRKLLEADLENLAEGFFDANINYAILAFVDSPLLGIGWFNLREMLGFRYEIHGTWLALAGYTGLIGLIAAVFFFGALGQVLYRWGVRSADPKLSAFLVLLFFFYLGLLITWIYTYPLRKREFWIFMTLVTMAVMIAKSRRAEAQVSTKHDEKI